MPVGKPSWVIRLADRSRPYAFFWCWIIWQDISPLIWCVGSLTMG